MDNMKQLFTLRKEKGVAGLNLFLEVISIIFMIGIIVMIFAIAGAKLKVSVYDSATLTLTNATSVSVVNSSTPTWFTGVSPNWHDCALSVTYMMNSTGTSTGNDIPSNNYTISGCYITYSGGTDRGWNNSLWNVTGSVSYDAQSEASIVINETYQSISEATDWFPTFIVLTAMVVLILLVVIIINAIRGAGIDGGA